MGDASDNSAVPASATGAMLAENFPLAIKYEDLCYKHAEYNPKQVLDRYEALYAGGPLFQENIERFKFLDKRSLDGGGGNGEGMKRNLDVQEPDSHFDAKSRINGLGNHWKYKLDVCRYTNYLAGMLDYFVQGVFKDDPSIIGTGDYWPKLNDDADGCGSNISTVGRGGLLNTLKFRRSYFSVSVPEVAATNRATQRAAGGLNPRINVLSAADVDLWEYEGRRLKWVRTYRKDGVRKQIFGAPGLVRELWTYITDKNLVEYEIVYDPKDPPKPQDMIARKPIKLHGFDRLPVIPIQINADLWAMQRLEAPALKLFNREAAMTCLLNDAAFQVFTVATAETPASVPDTSAGCLWVGQGGAAAFVGPQGAAFDAQYKDAELCKSNLYEVFQAMGVNALATQGQNARQSGNAKASDKEPLYALLSTFGFAAKSALKSAIALAAEFRGEKTPPELEGLKEFDSKSLDEKFQNLLNAQKIKGFPETAMRRMLRDAALAACATAPSEVKSIIETEAEEADIETEVSASPDAPVIPENTKSNDISVDNENGKG